MALYPALRTRFHGFGIDLAGPIAGLV